MGVALEGPTVEVLVDLVVDALAGLAVVTSAGKPAMAVTLLASLEGPAVGPLPSLDDPVDSPRCLIKQVHNILNNIFALRNES